MLVSHYDEADSAIIKISSECPAAMAYVDIDGNTVAEIGCQREKSIKVKPGNHVVTLKSSDERGALIPSRQIEIDQSETKYFILRQIHSLYGPTIRIEEVTKRDFDSLLYENRKFFR
jgi:hypothetical protein